MLAVRIHDACAGIAVATALVKGLDEGCAEIGTKPRLVVDNLDAVLADLRQLSLRLAGAPAALSFSGDLAVQAGQEARRLGVALQLDVAGASDWLTRDQAELIRLTVREAIRNVKRHSGVGTCRLSIDLSGCPFVVRVRDWGAGINGAARTGDGLTRLQDLAEAIGCDLAIASQPGLGTELVLTGQRCPLGRGEACLTAVGSSGSRSVVAKESLGSRRRVAGGRPIGQPRQQISE